MYNVGSPQGTHAFSTTPQGACIILSAAGSVACIVMCLGVPHVSHRLGLRMPEPMKRMSRLGLVSHSMHPKPLGQKTHPSLLFFHCFVCVYITLPTLPCMFACTLKLSVALLLTGLLRGAAADVDHMSLSASLELGCSAAYVCVSVFTSSNQRACNKEAVALHVSVYLYLTHQMKGRATSWCFCACAG